MTSAMSKRQVLMLLGLLTMILLFLGFPSSWEKAIAVIIGALVIFISYRSSSPAMKKEEHPNVPFIEHRSEPRAPQGSDSASVNP